MIILKKQRIILPMATQTKFCQKDCRYSPVCAQGVTFSDNNLSSNFQKKKKSRSKSRCWSSNILKDVLWEITHIGIMLPQETKLYVPKKRFSDIIELHWCPETNENEHWCTSWSNRRWWLKYWWRQSRCLNLGSSVTNFQLFNKSSLEEHIKGFKTDWLRNKLLQELNTSDGINVFFQKYWNFENLQRKVIK